MVGASATGLQLAAEIQASGRDVTLAVGEHVRMPRVYRGRDIQHWMHVAGLLDERYDRVDDIDRARGVPSPQLVGSDDRMTLDLNALRDTGVRPTGRLAGVRDGKLQFSGSLRNVCKLADLKMNRMLDTIDEWIAVCAGEAAEPPSASLRHASTMRPVLASILAAAKSAPSCGRPGSGPTIPGCDVPVLDRKGRIRHDGGVADAPGLFVMGLPYLRRRKSSFIHGAEDDATDLARHLAAWLDAAARRSRTRIAI